MILRTQGLSQVFKFDCSQHSSLTVLDRAGLSFTQRMTNTKNTLRVEYTNMARATLKERIHDAMQERCMIDSDLMALAGPRANADQNKNFSTNGTRLWSAYMDFTSNSPTWKYNRMTMECIRSSSAKSPSSSQLNLPQLIQSRLRLILVLILLPFLTQCRSLTRTISPSTCASSKAISRLQYSPPATQRGKNG